MISNSSTRLDTVYGRLHFNILTLTHDEYDDGNDDGDDDGDDDDYVDMMMRFAADFLSDRHRRVAGSPLACRRIAAGTPPVRRRLPPVCRRFAAGLPLVRRQVRLRFAAIRRRFAAIRQ